MHEQQQQKSENGESLIKYALSVRVSERKRERVVCNRSIDRFDCSIEI